MKWAILFFLTLSVKSFACMPIPLPKCQETTIKKDIQEFSSLLVRINDYQKFLSLSIKGKPTHSCFNQNFAGMHGEALLKSLKETKGMTCSRQLKRVQKSFKSLVSTNSDEFKATSKDSRIVLIEKGKVLEVKIRNFFESP